MRVTRLLLASSLGLFAAGAACGSPDTGADGGGGAAGTTGAAGTAGTGGAESSSGGSFGAAFSVGGGSGSGGTTPKGGSTGKGGSSQVCYSLADSTLQAIKMPGCGQCVIDNCNTPYSKAYGPDWVSGDYTTAGACSATMECVRQCGCDKACVSSKCSKSMACKEAYDTAHACFTQACTLPCNLTLDGGM